MVENFNDVKKTIKREEIKRKINSKISDVKDWTIRNKDEILVIAPVAIAGLTALTRTVGKNINLRKEETIKGRYCYDRSLGHYWKLRRDLSNDEWVEIDKRKQNGERLADILDSLKVLK